MFSSPMPSRPMTICFTVICSLLIALSLLSKADAATNVQQTLQASYDAQDAAIVQRDIDNTMVPYANDALFIDDVTGKEGASLDAIRNGWISMFHVPNQTLDTVTSQIQKITVVKTQKAATLLVLLRINISVTVRSGKVVPLEIDEQIRHYWVKGDSGWQIEQERIIAIDTYRDGKLVRHNRKPVAS